MTLARIILLALQQLDEDPQDVDEFHDVFMAYANEGYRIATEQYVKPRQSYPVRADGKGRIDMPFSDVRRVVSLRDEEGRDVPFQLSEDGMTLHTNARDALLDALCEVTYPDMMRDDEEPGIPASLHPALADYICYRYLSSGNLAKQSRAQVYSANYYRTMQSVRPQGMGSVTRYKNLYAATDVRYVR